MIESLFFGTYVGVSMAMTIVIDLLDDNWATAWFLMLASSVVCM